MAPFGIFGVCRWTPPLALTPTLFCFVFIRYPKNADCHPRNNPSWFPIYQVLADIECSLSLSVSLSVRPSVRPSARLSVYLYDCMYVYMYVCLSLPVGECETKEARWLPESNRFELGTVFSENRNRVMPLSVLSDVKSLGNVIVGAGWDRCYSNIVLIIPSFGVFWWWWWWWWQVRKIMSLM